MSNLLKLDQSKLLGFKIQPKQAEQTSAKLGAKIGGKPIVKLGAKIGIKPGFGIKSSTKPV